MHNHQAFFSESDRSEFTLVTTLEDNIKHTYSCAHSPFVGQRKFRLFLKKIIVATVILYEYVLGRKIFAKDFLGPLKAISPESVELLSWLSKHKYIKHWECNRVSPGSLKISTFDIIPHPIRVPDGKHFHLLGSTGNGIDTKLEVATRQALAEFIERHSTSSGWWNRSDLLRTSVANLRSTKVNYVDPDRLRLWKADYSAYDGRSYYNEKTQFRWVEAINLATQKMVLLPASCAYTFFTSAHTDEPILRETSSNGAAAQTSTKKAQLNAVLELIERDAFLLAWYHQKKVPKINLNSITSNFPEFKDFFKILSNTDKLQLTVLDITSDIGIPTFCAVLCNHLMDNVAVGVSAAANLDAKQALRKVILESCGFLSWEKPNFTEMQKLELLEEFNRGTVKNFTERKQIWSQQESIDAVQGFVERENEIDLDTVLKRYEDQLSQDLSFIVDRLQEKEISVFVVNYKNKLTMQAGLTVVRAISPELVPMFFDERNQPHNLNRFTHLENGEQVKLQVIPHPFI